MARRHIKPTREVVTDTHRATVQRIHIESAESMLVFDEKSPVWKTKKVGGRATFVTLKPPPDTSDAVIDEIKTKLYADCGARVVHVHAKQKALTVIAKEVYEEKSAIDIRKTVLDMVLEANTQDREALTARIEHSLAAVGL